MTGDSVVLSVAGEIDMSEAPAFEREVLTVLADRPHALVVDLSAVDFFGSHGISVLLTALRHALRYGVGFAVVADHRPVRRPLEVTDLAETLSLHATLPEALAALEDSAALTEGSITRHAAQR
ncbi:anti-anti-sigma factor [Saccharothrix tamanrassetensis]|uniref:Anti-sigma factor antagonist n=1 Tax=Saccharothrix tamanrassetensis TaxID=1051531 RepID=A0A841CWJ8_9PSEU|nr:anti-anti-sigma factor [Saccharothrix tamanrassetensis]